MHELALIAEGPVEFRPALCERDRGGNAARDQASQQWPNSRQQRHRNSLDNCDDGDNADDCDSVSHPKHDKRDGQVDQDRDEREEQELEELCTSSPFRSAGFGPIT